MRWMRHVACIREKRNAYRVLMLEAVRQHGRSGIDGRIILKCILNMMAKRGLDLSG
jgi:hypothetical protein